MELLKGYITPKRIRAALEKLPEQLGDAYDDIMDRIDRQEDDNKTIVYTALTWITYARRQLTVDELLQVIALGLEPDCTDIDSDDLIHVDLLLSSCAGLVILDNSNYRIARLVHYTTQEYLKKRFPEVDAHTFLAKSCLTYLTLDAFADPPENYARFMKQYPLSGYAATCWADHSRQGREQDLIDAILLSLQSETKRELVERMEYDYRSSRRSSVVRSMIPFRSILFFRSSRSSILHLTVAKGLLQTSHTLLKQATRLCDPI